MKGGKESYPGGFLLKMAYKLGLSGCRRV